MNTGVYCSRCDRWIHGAWDEEEDGEPVCAWCEEEEETDAEAWEEESDD